MENNKLSFNRRIALTKMEVFELLQSVELDKTANNKSGYYSIKSIVTVLNPVLEKYNLDMELNILPKEVLIIWYDCNGDNTRSSTIDISKIENIGRLPSMTNEVQSMGACLTYVRRYAYTVALNLNATDNIENNTGKEKNNDNQNDKNVNTTEFNNETLEKVQRILYLVANKNVKKSIDLLEKYTEFIGRDGEKVQGLRDFKKLKGGRLKATYGKLQKEFPLFYKQVKEYMSNKKQEAI